ncbi:unnamed protein product, partial [Effrenium voratum]
QVLPLVPEVANKALPKLLEDENLAVAKMAVQVAGKLGTSGNAHAEAVSQHLKHMDAEQRSHAAFSLARMGPLPPNVVKVLTSQLKAEKREDVRALLALAVGAQGTAGPAVLSALSALLKEPAVALRAAAMEALGCVGEDAAELAGTIAAVAVSDEDKAVRQRGFEALGRIGKAGIFSLATRLEDLQALSVRQLSLEALGQLSHLEAAQEAVPPVLRLLK